LSLTRSLYHSYDFIQYSNGIPTDIGSKDKGAYMQKAPVA